MRRILPIMVGNLLGLGLALVLGWTMARGAGAASFSQAATPTATPTPTSTPTLTRVHPVALAIARWVSQTFASAGITLTLSVTDVMTLHAQGFGYGEIARALQLVLASRTDGDPANDLSLEQALALGRQVGWGQAYRQYHLHPGGRGLGAIMRSAKSRAFTTPTPSATPSPSAASAPGPKPKEMKPPRGLGRGRR